MEKIVLKKIRLALNIVSILMFLVFLGVIFYTEKQTALKTLTETIKQIELLSNQAKLDTESTKHILEKDYLNRAHAIDYMLKNNEGEISNSTLEKIKELMEVESIGLMDSKGEIVFNSSNELIGLNLKDFPNYEPYERLLNSTDEKEYVLKWDGQGLIDQKPIVYVAVKSSLQEFSVLRIAMSSEAIEQFTEKNTIESIVTNMPTIREEAYFVISLNSGELEGLTQNNDQNLMFDNVRSKEEYMAKLESANEGIFLKINGSIKLLLTKNVDDKILGVYVDGNTIFKSIIFNVLFLIVCIYMLHLCVYAIVKHYLRKYVLKDLYSIESNIKKLMNGNKNITFETEYDTEFQYIMSVLNEWKNSYKYKSERMTRIMSSIGSHVGIFECLYGINQHNFSDNIQSILGIDTDAWNEIIKSPAGFEEYVKSLLIHSKEDIVALENGKYIQINAFSNKNEFYGMIMDKTAEIKELLDVQEWAELDSLTNLKNRAALENYVKKSLEIQPGKGVMLIFDLDNFKQVNDTLGHPEGDKVLKIFANCLYSFFKSNGFVARMGGDEFVVFMHTNITIENISDKLNSFLRVIHNELFDYYNRFGLSTSIGVAYVNPLKNSFDDLYKTADGGLYVAKNLGKDRFYIIHEE